MIKKRIYPLLIALFMLPTWGIMAQDHIIDEVVWIVGDEVILKSQIEMQRLNMMYEREQIEGDPYCVIPEMMAINKLFLNQAKIDSITVGESHVIQEVDATLNYYISELGSKERVEETFRKTFAEIREQLKDQVREKMIIQQVQSKIVGDIKVSPSQVRRFYQKLSSDSIPFIPTQVEVQIISLQPKIPEEEINAIKQQLREYAEAVNNGDKEFAVLARLYSEDVESAKRGGELGFMGKGILDPEFANVAFNLKDSKRVSKVVESEFGFHIIQLIEKRGDRMNCRHILLRPTVPQKAKDEALKRLDSIRNDILIEKFKFEEGALFLSNDKNTKNNKGLMANNKSGTSRFELQELPQEIAKVVSEMNIGDVSKPFEMITDRQKEMISIIKLKNKIEGHKANPVEDYQALKTIAESHERNEILQEWIKKKIKETYVSIKENYRNCDFQYEGWVKDQHQ